jgi:hypothetical protein
MHLPSQRYLFGVSFASQASHLAKFVLQLTQAWSWQGTMTPCGFGPFPAGIEAASMHLFVSASTKNPLGQASTQLFLKRYLPLTHPSQTALLVEQDWQPATSQGTSSP